MIQPDFAYIDPGTGSMLLQIILGGLAAAAVALKMFWNRVLVLLRFRKPEAGSSRDEPASLEPDGSDAARASIPGEPAGRR